MKIYKNTVLMKMNNISRFLNLADILQPFMNEL